MNQALSKPPEQIHDAFELLRVVPIESLNVVIEEYRHRVTGARHFHLRSDSSENVTVPTSSSSSAPVFSCPKCGRAFGTKHNMERHLTSACRQNPHRLHQWPCRRCGLTCCSKSSLIIHEKRCPKLHDLVCACERSFAKVGNFTNHQKVCLLAKNLKK